jgi:hypothetical protein
MLDTRRITLVTSTKSKITNTKFEFMTVDFAFFLFFSPYNIISRKPFVLLRPERKGPLSSTPPLGSYSLFIRAGQYSTVPRKQLFELHSRE